MNILCMPRFGQYHDERPLAHTEMKALVIQHVASSDPFSRRYQKGRGSSDLESTKMKINQDPMFYTFAVSRQQTSCKLVTDGSMVIRKGTTLLGKATGPALLVQLELCLRPQLTSA